MQGALVEAELLWPNDRAAARGLVTQALATLQPDLLEHNYWIADANAWMTAHPE